MNTHKIDQQLLELIGYHARTVRREFRFPESALLPQVKLCSVCCCPVDPNYSRCYACNERAMVFEGELADMVIPLSYAVRGHPTLQQFYSDLHQYKSDRPSLAAKKRLKALMLLFRLHHLSCLQAFIEQPISSVITVPSGKSRANHPLPEIAAMLTKPFGGSSGIPLAQACFVGQPRTDRARAQETDPNEFAINSPLSGHVVIVEDTWVKGNNAQSMAIKARRQGAEKVSIITLARMLDYDYGLTRLMVDTWQDCDHFDPHFCPVTGTHH